MLRLFVRYCLMFQSREPVYFGLRSSFLALYFCNRLLCLPIVSPTTALAGILRFVILENITLLYGRLMKTFPFHNLNPLPRQFNAKLRG
jgi:hypothetical protein